MNSEVKIVYVHGLLQGVDFFFSNRSHALKFVDFVQSVVPANCRDDKQLVSHNEHTATYNYKYTFSVEIVPICRVRRALAGCLDIADYSNCMALLCRCAPYLYA